MKNNYFRTMRGNGEGRQRLDDVVAFDDRDPFDIREAWNRVQHNLRSREQKIVLGRRIRGIFGEWQQCAVVGEAPEEEIIEA